MSKQVNNLLTQLGDPSVPLSQRAIQMIDIMAPLKTGEETESGNAELFKEAASEIFNRLQNQASGEIGKKREAFLKEIIGQLECSPLKPATFIQMSAISDGPARHALVTMDNGELAYIPAHDQDEARKLRMGDRIMVDAKMKIMVHPCLDELHMGTEARLERKVDDNHLEVITHQDERSVVMAGQELMGKIDKGEITPGAHIVLGGGGRLAVYALPQEDKAHFRFLDRGPVPDVIEHRDIGSPPRVIGQVARHVREEMTRPELRRRFKLRPCITRLLAGVSGSGKTLARLAIHRKVYEVMSEITGTPINELPPRVFIFKTSQMLSMWLGESDKNIDRLFDEVEKMADTKYANDKGKEFVLPVMVVMEEADGMGRSRGASQDAIYDRILTTLLQRLDPNRCSLANKLVVVISTTNEPQMVDPAFLRRIGGSVETFGRLDEKGFSDILTKHLDGIPLVARNSSKPVKTTQGKIKDELVKEVADWLFDNGDGGVVALTYQGQVEPEVKYLRDFLTGALIDRTVQAAATEAWESAAGGNEGTGVDSHMIADHLKEQVLSVAHQLVPQNVGSYLDIPENVRVTGVKRIQQKQHANK
jgi:ATP-dependent 26S proteasome regulatory subunit